MSEIIAQQATLFGGQLAAAGNTDDSIRNCLTPGRQHDAATGLPVEVPTGVHFLPVRKRGRSVKWYVYAWRGGPRILKTESPTKPTLSLEDIQRIRDAIAEEKAMEEGNLNGTLASLARDWQQSAAWSKMTRYSKNTWGSALRAILRKFGNIPAKFFYNDRMVPHIYEWRKELSRHPRAADTKICVLRNLLAYGQETLGYCKNIATGIPRLYRGDNRPEIIWREEDIARFVDAAIAQNKPALAMAILLAAETGLRRSDLITLKGCHLQNGLITKKALKPSRRNRRFVAIPILPSLSGLLERATSLPRERGVSNILVKDDGRPWTPEQLTAAFRRLRDRLNIVHVEKRPGAKPVVRKKTLHDLRGTFATKLVLAGLSDPDIAEVMGWSVQKATRIRNTYVGQGAKAQSIAARIQSGELLRRESYS